MKLGRELIPLYHCLWLENNTIAETTKTRPPDEYELSSGHIICRDLYIFKDWYIDKQDEFKGNAVLSFVELTGASSAGDQFKGLFFLALLSHCQSSLTNRIK